MKAGLNKVKSNVARKEQKSVLMRKGDAGVKKQKTTTGMLAGVHVRASADIHAHARTHAHAHARTQARAPARMKARTAPKHSHALIHPPSQEPWNCECQHSPVPILERVHERH